MFVFLFFCFKQKTAYEMRISDWSSDVCSSDLRCNVRTDNRVDLQRVIGGRCSKGRDWGFTATQIWVSGGCRAEFRYGYANNGGYPTPLPQPVKDYAGTIRCESRHNGYQQCNVATNDRVELVRRHGGRWNAGRSEKGRVGKEGVRTGRWRV